MVVEQLNDMANNGFIAYDSTIGKELHVMTSSLCFLADSPMHAEITNTHVPGYALNSCRRTYMEQIAQINSEQLNKLLQPHMDQDIPQKLVDMEKDKPLRMHNSFMRLEGFDSVKDTPNSWLYATEKFKSYNGILRFASIHSNRQSPSQDIAITFSNHHAFCQLLSGGFFWDSKQEKYVQCSYQVINLFSQHPLIQQTLGYNRSVSTQNINYPLVKRAKVPEIDQLVIPQHLKNGYSEHEIKQISELHLNKKQVIKKNYLYW
ncbi:hypothetical protein KEM48_013506 [Puccinia striiformis f. sp. tritici PST-130]|nr:hypothetical protein KEM48_013506 [Puccinia striiformis f. sp. tritici PST-130]